MKNAANSDAIYGIEYRYSNELAANYLGRYVP